MKFVKRYKKFEVREDIEGSWALCAGKMCVPLVAQVPRHNGPPFDLVPVHGSNNEIGEILEAAELDLRDLLKARG